MEVNLSRNYVMSDEDRADLKYKEQLQQNMKAGTIVKNRMMSRFKQIVENENFESKILNLDVFDAEQQTFQEKLIQ